MDGMKAVHENDAQRALSVVIPVLNEEESLVPLMARLKPVLNGLGTHEIIFVNDGSTDRTQDILRALHADDPEHVRVVTFKRNYGKATALTEGFREAAGEIVVMMDADLQDQPEEIPKLLNALRERNLDVVTGWKRERHDPLGKTVPSKLFNAVVRHFSKLEIHDFNCGLKAMKLECAKSLLLYGQLHRYLLVLLAKQGYAVGEVPIVHASRFAGVSKYGHKRMYEGLMDFITVLFIERYLQSPLYFFGFYGALFMVAALVIGVWYLSFHLHALFAGTQSGLLSEHPLWMVSPVFFLSGLLCIFFGLVGQLILHLNIGTMNVNPVRERLGCGASPSPEPGQGNPRERP